MSHDRLKFLSLMILGLILAGVLINAGLNKNINQPKTVLQPAVLAVSVSPQPSLVPGLEQALVTRVVDGDTAEINLNGKLEKVRYIGINTPETVDPKKPVECFGKEASDEGKKLLTGKVVILEKDVEDRDMYGRLLRYLYLPQDHNQLLFVNDFLVRAGYARLDTFPPDVKHEQQFTLAEQFAKNNNLGLWSKCQN